MTSSCAVLCGMPCSKPTAELIFRELAEHSYSLEWIRGNVDVSAAKRVDAYMRDLPPVWQEVQEQLLALDVWAVPDATRQDVAAAFSKFDVTILIAHHVQANDLASIGIELSDGVLEVEEIPSISPTSCKAVVDLLGVCRSLPFIPLVKARCGAARVLARETRIDPVAQLRLIPQVLAAWRARGGDYVENLVNLRLEMLRALVVSR